uniref:Uncharacterized protein n=1 Tax=Romanomermis culicivorax TaxID=13658 RepID=A0A915JZR5_ROMCU
FWLGKSPVLDLDKSYVLEISLLIAALISYLFFNFYALHAVYTCSKYISDKNRLRKYISDNNYCSTNKIFNP